MLTKSIWQDKITEVERAHQFVDGYKLLCCPWATIDVAQVAFVSLNPGKPPKGADLRVLSDERGNSYEVEQFNTESPITAQFLKFSSFLGLQPSSILTGVVCPFRGDRWKHFSNEQKRAGLNLGRDFWCQAMTKKIRTVVTLGDVATQTINNFLGAKLETVVRSGWGNITLKRFSSDKKISVIQLPHLSTFKIFSRDECKAPLEEIFEGLR
jgi:hypothetical protein